MATLILEEKKKHAEILFIQMGGTIDKTYPKTKNGYSFEIGEPAFQKILDKVRPSLAFKFKSKTVCQKDSQEIDSKDRHLLLKTIKESTCSKIIVTHGTDTLIETARFLETNLMEGSSKAKICNLKVILTGSFLPEKFKDSDADFNLGMALGALGALQDDNVSHDEKSSQVLIALNGLLIPAYRASRNQEGMFMIKDQTIFT